MKLIDSHIDILTELCHSHNVGKLYLFGSALNSNFNAKSDIDFLAQFKSIHSSKYFIKKMKTYTLNQVQDQLIGKIGTTDRDLFEYELQMDLIGKAINLILEKQ